MPFNLISTRHITIPRLKLSIKKGTVFTRYGNNTNTQSEDLFLYVMRDKPHHRFKLQREKEPEYLDFVPLDKGDTQ